MNSADNIFNGETDYFKESVFEKLKLTHASVSGIEFYDCTFKSCLLNETMFERCHFEKCVFINCDLSLAKFTETNLTDTDFVDSKLIGIDWTLSRKRVSFNFTRSILNDSTFYKLDLRKMLFEDCKVHNADFEETKLMNSSFKGSDLLNSKFGGANLSGADFVDAINYSINPLSSVIRRAKFSYPDALSLLNEWEVIIE